VFAIVVAVVIAVVVGGGKLCDAEAWQKVVEDVGVEVLAAFVVEL